MNPTTISSPECRIFRSITWHVRLPLHKGWPTFTSRHLPRWSCTVAAVRGALFRAFNGPITVEDLPDPAVPRDGVVIEVRASGLCRSDLFAWHGHDPGLALPHVPGHELAGVVAEAGPGTARWSVGDRVAAPFCCGCGRCEQCRAGNEQICDNYFQPGFTHWGSFARYCAISHADTNLAALSDDLSFEHGSILGCRMITAYRALIERARLAAGEWLVVHGCGGLGLCMVMIGAAVGARVVAVDIEEPALSLASAMGATATVIADPDNGRATVGAVRETTGGGAHVSVDALGNADVAANSVRCLRKQGRHVQAGLLSARATALPMATVVAKELEVLGTKGMSARQYPALMELISRTGMDLSLLVSRTMGLDALPEAFEAMADFGASGVAVVTEF
ncbi:MAG: alcohol dehydrogenase catalytic domain-containing protein [Acidimicrobiaceae bacterium]|nr:alcohol dehydrogenase catalytic domain-containing protein [Acidimicrobiaceae bacterium]MYB85674.1 alcohol dehydrogenase catalytic domain-containing protein [Acidimicrobiaceae bacterium]